MERIEALFTFLWLIHWIPCFFTCCVVVVITVWLSNLPWVCSNVDFLNHDFTRIRYQDLSTRLASETWVRTPESPIFDGWHNGHAVTQMKVKIFSSKIKVFYCSILSRLQMPTKYGSYKDASIAVQKRLLRRCFRPCFRPCFGSHFGRLLRQPQ